MILSLPRHLAIIMDGNGRWAKARGHGRSYGHIRGAIMAKRAIELCSDLGVKYLTLYAFSTENWMRPKQEIHLLMRLLARHLSRERRNLMKQNIRFTTIGDVSRIPPAVQSEIALTKSLTANNTGLQLVFALSYGGRQEITNVCRELVAQAARGELSAEEVTEQLFAANLETSDIPDPDLIIRTSGESRLSNFLLWQSAYSEIYITDVMWPEFDEHQLNDALLFYASRERRFGKVNPEPQVTDSVF